MLAVHYTITISYCIYYMWMRLMLLVICCIKQYKTCLCVSEYLYLGI